MRNASVARSVTHISNNSGEDTVLSTAIALRHKLSGTHQQLCGDAT